MNIYWNFEEIQRNENSIISLGTFDGFHRGHRVILDNLHEIANKEKLRPVLLTIHPHPQLVLQKSDRTPIKLLTSIEERLKVYENYGVINALIIPFTKEFAQTEPQSFVKDYLFNKIGFKKILIGHDHLFGKNREGNPDLLDTLGNELGFSVEKISPFLYNNVIISSTKIRNALKENKLEIANEYLGYNYFVTGVVVHGHHRGRNLGFPTANFEIKDENKLMPVIGIYLVSTMIDEKLYYGMASIGVRPTFENDNIINLEVNYFNFNEDIYGKKLIVNFHKYLRDEIKFDSIDELIKAIENDKRECELILENKLK